MSVEESAKVQVACILTRGMADRAAESAKRLTIAVREASESIDRLSVTLKALEGDDA